MPTIAAVGIGGTHFHYAAGTESGEILTEITTEPSEPNGLTEQVVDAVESLRERTADRLDAVGVACKGLIDHEAGVIEKIDVNNGPTRHGIDLRGAIDREFDLPLHLENDCTAATLAEYHFGAGRAHDSIVHVTIGTGIGAGVIDNGSVVRGETNFAGEVGGIPVGPADGLECFGIPGAWEAYCSGPGILEYVESRLAEEDRETELAGRDDLNPQCVFELAAGGDALAREYLEAVARYNGAGFGTVSNLYNPGVITVGGGVAQNNREWLLDGLDDHMGDYIVVDRPEILVTDFEEDIGIFGALATYTHEESVTPGAASAAGESASRS